MDNINDLYNNLLKQIEILRQENCELKKLLQANGIKYEPMGNNSKDSQYSPILFPSVRLSVEERVALFQSLFKGRTDVFARRWYSKVADKCGYQPVCSNEWRRGVCDKKVHKCADCPNRDFAPLSYHDVYRHLEGRDENCCDVVGLYVITLDNNCNFLCADFDDKSCKHGFKNDVLSFVGVCKKWRIPYAIERSRSGNGAHVWIFFESPISAFKARRLGNAILTEAMNADGRMSFDSYDRFFPNQDRIPEGGFGNLVALPLQGKARKNLNSVFVDDGFLAYQDQWSFLYHLGKLHEEKIDEILVSNVYEDLGSLSSSSESRPWETPTPQNITKADFDSSITIAKSDRIYIPLQSLSAKAINHLKRIAAFKNPEFYSKQALRLSTFSVPRIISCYDIVDDYLVLPRGCEEAVVSFFKSNNVEFSIVDETIHGSEISVNFKGVEREEQTDAINALLPYNNGVLHATTAFGKTVTAAAIIARRKVNTLVLVHSKALLNQWHDRLSEFLEIEYQEPEDVKKSRRKPFSIIGCLDSTGNSLHGVVDVALIQSCLDEDCVKPILHNYGMVIVDECHHVSSVTFENVLKGIRSQTVYGLTATPIRKDGHQPIIFMQCGPIRFSADSKSQIAKQNFERFLVPRFTTYHPITEEKQSMASLYQSLYDDDVRNDLIVEDVCKAVASGRTPIILSNRTAHVYMLADMLKNKVKNVVTLTGSGSAKEKKEVFLRLQSIQPDEQLAIVATGKYVGEGFDYPRLDSLFLALPISWKGLLAQYAGRIHREIEGKKDVRIFDYIDIHEPVCDSMYRKRLKGYAAIGYKVMTDKLTNPVDGVSLSENQESKGLIFNGKTFFRSYSADVSKAVRSVVISSPKLYGVNRNLLVELLCDLSHKGVEILVLTASSNDQTEILQRVGLNVRVVPGLSLFVSVIDKNIVWYGGINVLGFSSEEDNVIRVLDKKLADELILVLNKSK